MTQNNHETALICRSTEAELDLDYLAATGMVREICASSTLPLIEVTAIPLIEVGTKRELPTGQIDFARTLATGIVTPRLGRNDTRGS